MLKIVIKVEIYTYNVEWYKKYEEYLCKQYHNAQNVLWYKAVWIMPNYLLEHINADYVRRSDLKAKENIK